MTKEMSALIRTASGYLKVIHDDFYSTQKEFAMDLRGNGFKVLKIWKGYKTNSECDEWEFMNRK